MHDPARSPLSGPPPAEVPLPKAPLAKVLFQVRFPRVLALAGQDRINIVAGVQDALKAKYPLFSEESAPTIQFTPNGPVIGQDDKIWRFSDIKKEWRVSVTPEFATLETSAYSSRADFARRAQFVLDAIERTVSPGAFERVGVRYINRISGDAIAQLNRLVKPAALGLVAAPSVAPSVQQALSEALLEAEEGQVLMRSFVLPPNVVFDPSLFPPMNERTWVLDIDLFSTDSGEFEAKALAGRIELFSTRIYSVFRWVVEDAFLTHFGGSP